MRVRLLSLHAYDAPGMMWNADVVEGAEFKAVIVRLFANPKAGYLHVHNTMRVCYSGRIDPAP